MARDSLPVIGPRKWEKRFIIDSARAAEAARLYRSIGFEVRTQPVRNLEELKCTDCFSTEDELVEVWTRPPAGKRDKGSDQEDTDSSDSD